MLSRLQDYIRENPSNCPPPFSAKSAKRRGDSLNDLHFPLEQKEKCKHAKTSRSLSPDFGSLKSQANSDQNCKICIVSVNPSIRNQYSMWSVYT